MRTLLLLVLSTGCSSAAAQPDAPEPTLASIQAKVFGPTCASAGCHHIDLPKQGVSLANEELSYQSLVGIAPRDPAIAAKYPALVVPGAPDRSFLVRKLRGPTSGEGLRMPEGMSALDDATIAAIERWIAQGAKR